ncbi:MAG: phage tail tape measure protein, partial [Gemmatimonadaceae bacterium]
AAVGGFTDVNTVVDGLTSTFNAFKAEGLTVAEIADKMAEAVDAGKVEFADLANHLGAAAGVAATVGVKLDDVLAITAQLSVNGIDAATALVGVRSALVNIIRPSEQLAKDYPELAKGFDLAALKSKGLVQFLIDLYEATGGNEKAITAVLPDVQGLTAALASLKDGGAGLVAMQERIANAHGGVAKKSQAVTEATKSQDQVLRNQLSETLRELGTQLLPAYNAGLQKTLDLVTALNGAQARTKFAIQDDARLATIGNLTPANLKAAESARGDFNAPKAMRGAWWEFQSTVRDFLHDYENGWVSMERVTAEQAQRAAAGIRSAAASGMVDLQRYSKLLSELDEKAKKAAPALAAATAPGAGGVAGKPNVALETPEEVEAEKEAAKLAAHQLEAAGEAAEQRAETVGRILASQAEEATRLIATLEERAVQSTATAVDDLSLALERLIKQARPLLEQGLISRAAYDQLVALGSEALVVAEALERAQKAIHATERPDGKVNAGDLRALAAAEAGLQVQLRQTAAGAEREKIEQAIEAVQKRRAEIEKQITEETKKGNAAAEKRRDHLRETARAIEAAARGALQLAEAFGIVDDATAAVLANVAQLGANLPGLIDELGKVGKKGTDGKALTSAAALAGAVLPVVGAVAALAGSLFGDSAEEKERKRVQRENTVALRELAARIGDLAGSRVSGAQLTGARTFLDALLNDPRAERVGNSATVTLGAQALAAAGTSERDLKEIAEALGITLDGTVGALRKLRDAILAADLAAYTETFAGSLRRLQDTFAVYGVTDPAKQLQMTIAAVTNAKTGIPALAKALAGIDTTTQEGAQGAIAALQQLFEQLATGELSAADLGAASLDEARQTIVDLIQQLRSGAGLEGTGGFNVDRTITEASASHLAGILTSGLAFWRRTAEAVEALAGIRVGAPVAIAPPATSTFASPSAGVAFSVASLTVQVVLPAGADPATAAGAQAVGAAVATGINDALARELFRRRRLAGDAAR